MINRNIFVGNIGTIKNVFSKEVIAELERLGGIDDSFALNEINIESYREAALNSEYAFSTWGMPAFSSNIIKEYFPKLKVVFYAAGSVQSFAKPFLENGIRVFSAWGANAVPVAEYTVSQIILANKGFFQGALKRSRGEINAAAEFCNSFPGNFGCKVGIIGAGMIGSLVIRMLNKYNIRILAFDPFMSDKRADELGVEKCSLEDIFDNCQTISNHLANNEQTKGMLDYKLFSLMKNNATFINTGRGAQVVEEDLIKVLTEKPDITAVLDVTEPEPPCAGHPFYQMDNVILTPHIAGSLGSEVIRMSEYMLCEYKHLINGEQTNYEVTSELLRTMA